jgi:hypothetical protein
MQEQHAGFRIWWKRYVGTIEWEDGEAFHYVGDDLWQVRDDMTALGYDRLQHADLTCDEWKKVAYAEGMDVILARYLTFCRAREVRVVS